MSLLPRFDELRLWVHCGHRLNRYRHQCVRTIQGFHAEELVILRVARTRSRSDQFTLRFLRGF